MKKSFIKILVILIIYQSTFVISSAKSSPKMSYQAVIRNSSDALVTNTQVGIQISILQGSASGSAVYVETQTPTTNANGLISIEIGGDDATVVTGSFATIDWANGPYFIKTETDPAGGTSYTITGTSQLLSVPYALHAKTAETVSNEIQNLSQVLTQGNDGGTFQIKNIADPTDAQDAATKDYVDELEAKVAAMEDMLIDGGLYMITDIDSNTYKVVKIGTQVWMAENLKTTRYNDGSAIPLVTDNTEWSNLTTPGYSWYNNDSATYARTYGALYNWYTVETGNLCPTGWHVPSDAEWTTLTDYLGGEAIAGGKLKETGTAHWDSPNTGATDETGFTAFPGGNRTKNGPFSNLGAYNFLWSATTSNTSSAWIRSLFHLSEDMARYGGVKISGLSVRCIKN
jgi:uncharacterized protein (TIGR02145 family)